MLNYTELVFNHFYRQFLLQLLLLITAEDGTVSTCVEDNISGNVDDGVWCGSRSPTYPQQATVATAANDNATISYIARKHGLTAIVLDAISLIDPLSAVDTHVGKHLFDECVTHYLANKTRVLITHQVQFLRNADIIILINNVSMIRNTGCRESNSTRLYLCNY